MGPPTSVVVRGAVSGGRWSSDGLVLAVVEVVVVVQRHSRTVDSQPTAVRESSSIAPASHDQSVNQDTSPASGS